MSYSKRAILVRRLLNGTKHGTILWEVTPEDEVFQTSIPNYSIRITYVRRLSDGSGAPVTDYIIQIYNQDARLIEEFSDVELSGETDDDTLAYGQMEEIYNYARRGALGLDKALDDILEALGPDLDNPGRLPF